MEIPQAGPKIPAKPENTATVTFFSPLPRKSCHHDDDDDDY